VDTREWLKRLFKSHREIKQDLGVRRFQISHFSGLGDNEVITALTFSSPDGEYVQNSNITDKSGRIAIMYKTFADSENMELLREMVRQYEKQKRELDAFERCIKLLEPRLSEVITDMVINRMPWDELQSKYQVSRATLKRYRKKAVDDICKMFEFEKVALNWP